MRFAPKGGEILHTLKAVNRVILVENNAMSGLSDETGPTSFNIFLSAVILF